MNVRGRALISLILALTMVFAYSPAVAQQQPSPESATTTPPQPLIKLAAKLHGVYIISTGSNYATRTKLIGAAMWMLSQNKIHVVGGGVFIPEPDWAVSDYINACSSNRDQTIGAFIVGLVSQASGIDDFFILRYPWTNVAAFASFASCDVAKPDPITTPAIVKATPTPSVAPVYPQTITVYNITPTAPPTAKPSPGGQATLQWVTDVYDKTGKQLVFTPLPLLSFLLAGTAAFVAFAPSKTLSSVTSVVYPSPSPLPKSGYETGTQTTSGTTSNASATSLGTVATGTLPYTLSYTTSQVNTPSSDQQAWLAVKNLMEPLVRDLCNIGPNAAGTKCVSCPSTIDAENGYHYPFCIEQTAARP